MTHCTRLERAAALLAAASLLLPAAAAKGSPDATVQDAGAVIAAEAAGSPKALATCTIAVPDRRASVGVRVGNAADFCELLAQVLAGSVFRSPVLVTPGQLWHYADAALSCRLRYGSTRSRMTVHNSARACRWLVRHFGAWRPEIGPEDRPAR